MTKVLSFHIQKLPKVHIYKLHRFVKLGNNQYSFDFLLTGSQEISTAYHSFLFTLTCEFLCVVIRMNEFVVKLKHMTIDEVDSVEIILLCVLFYPGTN